MHAEKILLRGREGRLENSAYPDGRCGSEAHTVGGDDTGNSDTIAGKRGRAPRDEELDSDIPAQSSGKRRREGDLHPAFVAEKKVAKEHAQ